MPRSGKPFTKRTGSAGSSASKVWRFGKRLAKAANESGAGNARAKLSAVLKEVIDPADAKDAGKQFAKRTGSAGGSRWGGRGNMRSKHTIYKLTNKKDGTVYIGRTNDLTARMVEHEENAAKGAQGKLYDAIRKEGWRNFSKEALETNLNDAEADKAERVHISKARNTGKCYNVQSGGKQGYAEWVRERKANQYKRGAGNWNAQRKKGRSRSG